jgi:hypothetical protein
MRVQGWRELVTGPALITGIATLCAVMGANLGGWAGALMIGIAVVLGGPFALILLGFSWNTAVRVEPPGRVVVSRGFLALRKTLIVVNDVVALDAQPPVVEGQRWHIVARTADGRAVSVIENVGEAEACDAARRLHPDVGLSGFER